MSELEQLLAKSHEDLAAIAVQFGDFTPEVAATKTREELIYAISGESVSIKPEPKKRGRKPGSKKKEITPDSDNTDSSAADVPTEEPAQEPVKESAKKTRGRPKKNVSAEEAASQNDETARPKKTRKGKKKSVPQTEIESGEISDTSENQAAIPSDPSDSSEDNGDSSTSDKPSTEKKRRGRKPKASKASIETAPETSPTAENKESETEKSKEESPAPKKTKSIKSPLRRTAFGPKQEPHEVEIPDNENAQVASRDDVSDASAQSTPEAQPVPEIVYTEIEGVLSIGGENKNDFCGFIHRNNYLPGEGDAYVPGQIIKRYGLRRGDYIRGLVAPARGKDKFAPLRRLTAVNGMEIDENTDSDIIRKRPRFENLTAIYPDERLTLETGAGDLSARIIDLFCPIGKGQRGMIVSPPKAGKTILLKKVANAITANNPDCKVIVLLIDERPEEVTDMQRSIKGEVVYSTFDKRPENHVRVTELVLERAMRLVELGEDVVILLDSMTRLARAYNLTINPTGRTLSGGLDPGSLYGPKRFFGAARNIENGGSLTIIATALIETGSRMDEVIFEEFKGTGNMEVVLDRKLADKRVFPAIAVDKSGTRREDLLLTEEELDSVWRTRKAISDVDTIAATEAVINFMRRTANNKVFILSAQKSFSAD